MHYKKKLVKKVGFHKKLDDFEIAIFSIIWCIMLKYCFLMIFFDCDEALTHEKKGY